jgi:hypothetical protein
LGEGLEWKGFWMIGIEGRGIMEQGRRELWKEIRNKKCETRKKVDGVLRFLFTFLIGGSFWYAKRVCE